ncbi:DUF2129 domain-containing protein [Haploplasma modicum]|uniref:DUF2129 domain-containing protein n=1 Tax=Haploplasma modicum TaxID=2150 RepID=UPI00047DAB3F|nr:DUF2129 domain-containing protein [Haploplasma modicum]
MDIERMLYIIYFKGNHIIKKIETLPVNVSYVSKKMNYATFYGEKSGEKNYFNQLKNVKGFLKFEKSESYNEEVNYQISNNVK